MARRSLKPQLNQIRAWVKQGRTDAWIAHQLEVTVAELREFRNQHALEPDEEAATSSEVELRDEIEAEVEAATAEEAAESDEPETDAEEGESEADTEEETSQEDGEADKAEEPASEEEGGTGSRTRRRRRRGKRGGRGRRREFEATFDHGERDGYGLWLDPSVKDNPVYAENWAGKREVSVRIEADQIVIRRSGESGNDSDD